MSNNVQGEYGLPPYAFYTGWSDVAANPNNYRGTAPPIGIFALYTGWSDAPVVAVTRTNSGMLAAKHMRRRIRCG